MKTCNKSLGQRYFVHQSLVVPVVPVNILKFVNNFIPLDFFGRSEYFDFCEALKLCLFFGSVFWQYSWHWPEGRRRRRTRLRGDEEARSESRLSYRSLQERRDGLEAFKHHKGGGGEKGGEKDLGGKEG